MAQARGSQRHIRWYVNEAPEHLNAALFTASPSLAARATDRPYWVSPLAAEDYLECWNERFLIKLGLEHLLPPFRAFWPFRGQGTPHWDALARVPLGAGEGVVLLEAKAHRGEFLHLRDRSGARGASLATIHGSLAAARSFYGVPESGPAWDEVDYQVVNRLAHLYWMNEVARRPTWLVWLFVLDDPLWPDQLSAPDWYAAFQAAMARVGLPQEHPLADRIAALYLPPAPPEATGQ
jgi:hypothetical protein